MARDPDILVDVTNASSAEEAEMLAQFLTQNGTPAHAQTLAGAMNPWDLGSSVPFRIAVRRRDLERAAALIRDWRHGPDAGSVDWDAEDVGPMPANGDGEGTAGGSRDSGSTTVGKLLRRVGSIAMVVAVCVWLGPRTAGAVLMLALMVEVAFSDRLTAGRDADRF